MILEEKSIMLAFAGGEWQTVEDFKNQAELNCLLLKKIIKRMRKRISICEKRGILIFRERSSIDLRFLKDDFPSAVYDSDEDNGTAPTMEDENQITNGAETTPFTFHLRN